MSSEFLIPGLLAVTSHLMGETKIKVTENQLESCIVYVALVANPGTGKTPSQQLILKSLYDIESFENVAHKDSKIINGKYSAMFVYYSLY